MEQEPRIRPPATHSTRPRSTPISRQLTTELFHFPTQPNLFVQLKSTASTPKSPTLCRHPRTAFPWPIYPSMAPHVKATPLIHWTHHCTYIHFSIRYDHSPNRTEVNLLHTCALPLLMSRTCATPTLSLLHTKSHCSTHSPARTPAFRLDATDLITDSSALIRPAYTKRHLLLIWIINDRPSQPPR